MSTIRACVSDFVLWSFCQHGLWLPSDQVFTFSAFLFLCQPHTPLSRRALIFAKHFSNALLCGLHAETEKQRWCGASRQQV